MEEQRVSSFRARNVALVIILHGFKMRACSHSPESSSQSCEFVFEHIKNVRDGQLQASTQPSSPSLLGSHNA
jgi:hypothetical protein